MSQTTIFDHFSPKSARKTPSTTKRVALSSSESEGSEGLEGIQLSTKRNRTKPKSSAQKRAAKRVVGDSDEEEWDEDNGDGEEKEGGPSTGSAIREAKDRPHRPAPLKLTASTESTTSIVVESAPAAGVTSLRRSSRHPISSAGPSTAPPLVKKSTFSRSKLSAPSSRFKFSIELPSLSQEERSRYSPMTTSASTPNVTSRHRSPVVISSDEDDDAPIVIKRKVSKGKQKASRSKRTARSPGSSTSPIPIKRRNGKARENRVEKESIGKQPQAKVSEKRKRKEKRPKARDPDDTEDAVTDEEDMVAELELDEPDRFKSATRLREKRESSFQRTIRKARNKRLGIVESDTEESDEEESEEEGASDSAPSSRDFIEEDGGEVPDDLLPHQFSLNSAQTPEFKFKVVFHYLLYLVMNGPKALPLKGDTAEYFLPQLRDIRRRMEGYKNGRVRSQIWPIELVRALETYPDFTTIELNDPVTGCDACKRRLTSRIQVVLGGDPYDKDTHQALDDASTDSEPDVSSSQAQNDKDFTMGTFCHRRARVYHSMCHWEDDLYDRIRVQWHDLLRARDQQIDGDSEASSTDDDPDSDEDAAKIRRADRTERRARTRSRVEQLRQQSLPKDPRNVDKVLMWMDERRFQSKLFHILEDLVNTSARLEHDKSRDE